MLSSTTSAPRPLGRGPHRRDEVVVAVVDEDLGAELAAALQLLRRTRGDGDPGADLRASWIAIVPMPDEPPCTRSVSPGRRPAAMKTFDQTVQTTSGSPAASTRSTPAGTGSTCPAGTATCSA